MWKAKLIVAAWKAAVMICFMMFIIWMRLVSEHWLLILLLYTNTGLLIRYGFGGMIPTHPDGRPIEPIRSNQDYIAFSITEFCNQYAFPLLWPFIVLLITLNPFRVRE